MSLRFNTTIKEDCTDFLGILQGLQGSAVLVGYFYLLDNKYRLLSSKGLCFGSYERWQYLGIKVGWETWAL
mgnify:CR=1 FL=1